MNAPLLLPPHSVEAEQALVGALIADGNAWDRVGDSVRAADFYTDQHRRIFTHIAVLCNSGKVCDIVSLFNSISESNEQDQTGGLQYLGELANNSASSAQIKTHATIIKSKAALRRVQEIATQLLNECYTPGIRKVDELIAVAEVRLAQVLDVSDEPITLAEGLVDALQYIDGRDGTQGLRTGFRDFDRMTGGLEPGQLVVVAARPSVGKSAFACNIAQRVVAAGKAVMFFTLEMTKRDISMRILGDRANVSVKDMRHGLKDNLTWDRMSSEVGRAANQRLWIDDKPAVPVAYVRARSRRMQRKHGLDMIVIDYLGLMHGEGDNRTQQIGSITRGLKALAKELNLPILLLAQLNRGVEGRTDKRPMMSDLRDSGEIEQDADIVMMLHREELYDDGFHWKGLAEALIRKNRNGETGEFTLNYQAQWMRFTDSEITRPTRIAKSNRLKD